MQTDMAFAHQAAALRSPSQYRCGKLHRAAHRHHGGALGKLAALLFDLDAQRWFHRSPRLARFEKHHGIGQGLAIGPKHLYIQGSCACKNGGNQQQGKALHGAGNLNRTTRGTS